MFAEEHPMHTIAVSRTRNTLSPQIRGIIEFVGVALIFWRANSCRKGDGAACLQTVGFRSLQIELHSLAALLAFKQFGTYESCAGIDFLHVRYLCLPGLCLLCPRSIYF